MSRALRHALCLALLCALLFAVDASRQPAAAAAATADTLAESGSETVEGPEQAVLDDPPVAEPEPPVGAHAGDKDWLSTAMNLGTLAFLIWMAALLWRPGLGRSLMTSSEP